MVGVRAARRVNVPGLQHAPATIVLKLVEAW